MLPVGFGWLGDNVLLQAFARLVSGLVRECRAVRVDGHFLQIRLLRSVSRKSRYSEGNS